MKQAKSHKDAFIFLMARYAAFIVSSIISALLNVFFFISLEQNYAVFFACAAIALECTKLTSIMTANSFNTLNKKFPTKSLVRNRNIFYGWYAVFAALAILASLNFSFMVTSKTDTRYLATKTQYETQYQELVDRENEIKILQGSIANRMAEAESKRDYAIAEHRAAQENADAVTMQYNSRVRSENPLPWADVQAARNNRALKETIRNEETQNVQTLETRLNLEIETKQTEYSRLLAQYQIMVPQELQDKLVQLDIDRAESAGANLGFILLAKTLRMQESSFKLMMLLIVSLLIELTILTTAPDIHITRRFLYYFKNSLPDNVPIEKILKVFDRELVQFSDLDSRLDKIEEEEVKLKKGTIIELPAELDAKTRDKAIEAINKPVEMGIMPTEHTVAKKPRTKKAKKPLPVEIAYDSSSEKTLQEQAMDALEASAGKIEIVYDDLDEEKAAETTVLAVGNPQPETLTTWTAKNDELDDSKIFGMTHDQIAELTEAAMEAQIDPSGSRLGNVMAKINQRRPSPLIVPTIAPTITPAVKEPEVVLDTAAITDKASEITHPYRFGKTTETFKNKLVLFLNGLFDGTKDDYVGLLKNPHEVATKIDISKKVESVFLKRLLEMRYNGTSLVYVADNQLKTDFTKQFLIDYTTQILEAKNGPSAQVNQQTTSN